MKEIEKIEKALEIIANAKKDGIKAFECLISENGSSTRTTIVYPRVKVGCDDYEFIYALFTNYSLQRSSTQFVFEVSRRRRGPQYQRSTGDNPLQEIFAF